MSSKTTNINNKAIPSTSERMRLLWKKIYDKEREYNKEVKIKWKK
jgi:hypothetical protein